MTPYARCPGSPYRRYLVNHLRAAYGFVGTPIRLVLKGKSE
ncbi:MAG: hypothetical protein FIA90_09080 [candidate division NC10 bacterium]|nr:hypothetical protein [candidate division NC10 bacterium]